MRLMDTPIAAQHSGSSQPSAQSQETARQIVAVARLDAEVRLAQAVDRVSAGGSSEIPDWDARPETLLVVASRLFEAGGHANYLRSSQLSQVVIHAYGQMTPVVDLNLPIGLIPPGRTPIAPLRAGASAAAVLWTGLRASLGTGMRTTVLPRLRLLSLRAPLLVLLLGWLAFGVAGGVVFRLFRAISPDWFSSALLGAGFDLWGLGFLLLVCFGFYVRIRKVTF